MLTPFFCSEVSRLEGAQDLFADCQLNLNTIGVMNMVTQQFDLDILLVKDKENNGYWASKKLKKNNVNLYGQLNLNVWDFHFQNGARIVAYAPILDEREVFYNRTDENAELFNEVFKELCRVVKIEQGVDWFDLAEGATPESKIFFNKAAKKWDVI